MAKRVDDFKASVRNAIAARVGYRCSNPKCRALTVGPAFDSGRGIRLGQAAHIKAASPKGPRYDAEMSSEDRTNPDNGIWLCCACARLVDVDPLRYPEETLRKWKHEAENEALRLLGQPAAVSEKPAFPDEEFDRSVNSRFGFSFLHPRLWDRQDPDNGDGNIFRNPSNAAVEMRAWGGFAVVTHDLQEYADSYLPSNQEGPLGTVISKVPSGLYVVDYIPKNNTIETQRMELEGIRAVYEFRDGESRSKVMHQFAQFEDTQFSLRCAAPAENFSAFESLFIFLCKGLRVFGPNAAPMARSIRESPVDDEVVLASFAKLFDRPAFYTPIHQESNLADFKQAITDTIQALGTGIWKARDGNVISRIPSRHELKSEMLRTKMQAVEKALSRLRAVYDQMITTGTLKRCACGNSNCQTFFFNPPQAADELEQSRHQVLAAFRDAYPAFMYPSW